MDKDRKTDDYPRTFVCTFCKQEFSSISSVFSHMSKVHGFAQKSLDLAST